MKGWRGIGIVMGILLVLATVRPLAAQEVTATIVGTVKDKTGAVVAGATVTITDSDKKIVVKTVTTDESGNFLAALLPVGTYSVEIKAPGFKSFTKTGIELHVSDRYTLNPSLEVGAVTESVTVAAEAIQVEQQSATASGLILGTEVRELSLNNRVFEQLVTLQPGVSSGAGDQLYIGTTNPMGTVNRADFAINGARTTMNNWTIDGADNVDRGANLTLLNYPSVDAIAEFKILRSLYNPEYGRAGGGQVNIVTRSGEQNFHGSAYEFWRNDALNANNWFAKRDQLRTGNPNLPAKLRYNNFGFTLGGPVNIPHVYEQKEKTFFFVSEEWRRVITYATASALLPTAQEKAGSLQYTVCIAYSGSTCTATGTQIPVINPVAAAYIQDIYSKLPDPADPVTHSYSLSTFRNVFNNWQNLVRVDHVFGPKLRVFGRYLHDTIPTQEPFSLFSSGVTSPGVSNSETKSPGTTWAARATATLSPTFLVEAGYSYSYGAIISRLTGLMDPANSPDILPLIKLPFQPTLQRIPSLSITGFNGTGAFGPYDDFNRNHSVFGTVTKMLGHHAIKAGLTYHHYQKSENNGGNNPSTFSFDTSGAPIPSGCTGTCATRIRNEQAWANFLLGRVATFSQASVDLTPDMEAHQIETFVQDEWRVRPNLTVTYGVRYSIFRQPIDANKMLTNFDPSLWDPAKAPAMTSAGLLCLTGTCINGTTPNPNYDPLNGIIIGGQTSPYGGKIAGERNRDFAPRIGISWDPFGHGRTSVRSGYGISHDFIAFGNYELNIFQNPPFVQNISIPSTIFQDPGSAVASVSLIPRVLRALDPNFKTPYVQFWSLDIQHELLPNLIVDVGYYGSAGTHLLGNYDLNQPTADAFRSAPLNYASGLTTSTQTRTLNVIRPYVGYDAINYWTTMYTSNYNSLQAALQKRFKDGSLIKVNYTYSHGLGTNDYTTPGGVSTSSTAGFGVTAPQNSANIRAEYGPTSLDRRHMFTADWVYHLPFFSHKSGLLGQSLGGWQLSGILTINSGLPLTPRNNPIAGTNTDVAGIGCLGSSPCILRPDMVGDPNLGAPQTQAQWFNTWAFAGDTTLGRPGNAGRGTIKGPGYQKWDLSVFKNFTLKERFKMQFRAEAFNTFNHVNWSAVRTQLTSSDYGQVISARDPRIMQLALKMNF